MSQTDAGRYVGIDVAQARLDVAVREGGRPVGRPWHVANTPAGIAQLVERLRAASPPRLIVLAATGGLEYAAATARVAAGWPVASVNPRQPHAFVQSSGQWAKTDRIDARGLAHVGAVHQPPAWTPPTPAQHQTKGVVTRREQVQEMDLITSLTGVPCMARDQVEQKW